MGDGRRGVHAPTASTVLEAPQRMPESSILELLVRELSHKGIALWPDGTFWNAVRIRDGKTLASALAPYDAASIATQRRGLTPAERAYNGPLGRSGRLRDPRHQRR